MANYVLNYFQSGMQNWLQIPLTTQSFSIGRTTENDLPLSDVLVSRQHAGLYVDERGVWIIDKNSSNGVTVGGVRIPAGEWQWLPLSNDILMGTTTLRVEAVPVNAFAAQPVGWSAAETLNLEPAANWQVPLAQPVRKSHLPLIIGLVTAVIILIGLGFGAWYILHENSEPDSNPDHGISVSEQPSQTPAAGPPQVIDNLAAIPGGGAVQDDQGVSISIPEGSLANGQQAYLERAKLSPGMQADIEKAYQVDSLLYAVNLKDSEDGTGRVDLSLPAPSPDARLAVLVDDRYLGILETPAEDGVFHVLPGLIVPAGGQGYPEPDSEPQTPNRYLVVTPKSGTTLVPQETMKLASFARAPHAETKACISEFWMVNHCLSNAEGSVYVFWENDVPASLKDQEYLRIEDAIASIADIMGQYQQKGFTAAAISPSNPAYLIVEAGASEPYYSFKTGNVYLPWDIIGGISEPTNQCSIAHEFFHWIEDEEYVMGSAALSNAKSWWLEVSAENGSFMLYPACIDQNLTKYGIVTTPANVLGFQAAPFLWDGGEQARYIHALPFYLSLCDGGAGCALSREAWAQAINSGTYPMESGAAAYMSNAKDLGLYLLGAAPQQSRLDAKIPPSAASGSHYGDYLILKTGGKSIWDFGMTTNQFNASSPTEVAVTAKIEKGGVYPLWVGNGTGTPMGGVSGRTGLPGLLEIQPGPAFWIRQDQNEPVFYPAGTGLKIGPISDKLGIGKARIVAVAPDGAGTFQARVTLADFSGDWVIEGSKGVITPVNCEGYSPSEGNTLGNGPDQLLGFFSGYGEYVNPTADETNLNLVWQGSLPEGLTGSSEVSVAPDQITLHYRIEIPKQADTSSLDRIPGIKAIRQSLPDQDRNGPGNPLLALLPGAPLLAGAAWFKRRRKNTWLGVVLLLILGSVLLYGCVGIGIWGNIDATYTFNRAEYVGPQPGTTATDGNTQAIWKLSDGKVKYDIDLTMTVSSDDADGNTTETESPCVLTATGSATATIAPEGSVTPPDISQ